MTRSPKKTVSSLLGAGLLLSSFAYADDFQFPDYYQNAFDYCAAVRNADHPDNHHVANLLPDDALRQIGAKNPGYVVWRCMNGQVWACSLDKAASCDTKVDMNSMPVVGSIDARGYAVNTWTLLGSVATAAVPAPLPPAQLLPPPALSDSNTMDPNANVAIVTAGDTLYSIAKATGTSVDYLRALNGLTSDQIFVGQRLFFR